MLDSKALLETVLELVHKILILWLDSNGTEVQHALFLLIICNVNFKLLEACSIWRICASVYFLTS
jgi:hypothetical protein